ncbi:MAG TPA: gamma-glutamyl-gamma-aminobutyrate hydrolase family protein [Ignavibacteria bacterium]|nr:gamma-glutamyl-gamma-aminobutyrate hydrolase family protein [Ignavibacteria bacterium]
MKIGISDSESKFTRYTDWLEYNNVNFEILNFKNSEADIEKLNDCSGLILTGGVDIYPELYCDWDTLKTKGSYSPGRDGFELNLFEKALSLDIPVLGICRGLQLMNVYFRGSLIFDIDETRNISHRKISKLKDRIHKIFIFKDTLLYEIIGLSETNVNSSHHQAVDRLGEGLMINCKSDDGIVEGIEYADKTDKPFLLGVQWHPERLHDLNDPAAINILNRFVSECNKIIVKQHNAKIF